MPVVITIPYFVSFIILLQSSCLSNTNFVFLIIIITTQIIFALSPWLIIKIILFLLIFTFPRPQPLIVSFFLSLLQPIVLKHYSPLTA